MTVTPCLASPCISRHAGEHVLARSFSASGLAHAAQSRGYLLSVPARLDIGSFRRQAQSAPDLDVARDGVLEIAGLAEGVGEASGRERHDDAFALGPLDVGIAQLG